MDQGSDDNHDAELSDSREEVPIENKCELCGTEFVTSTSLKIHRLKCVKMNKELQQNRQITPEVLINPEPEVVKSAAPEVQAAKQEVQAAKPEVQAAKVNTTKIRAHVVVQAEPHEPLTKTRTSPEFRVIDEVDEEETDVTESDEAVAEDVEMCRICSSSHLDENRLHIHLILYHFEVCFCNSG